MDVIAARWDIKAADWERHLQDPSCHLNEDQAYERFLDRIALIIQQRQAFCRVHGVIDAGCATGLVLAKITPFFAWGIGLDISPQMIEIAGKKQLANAKFLVGDCFSLRATCPQAGAVVSRGVLLSHYGQLQGQALLRSVRACLSKGGFVFWDFLNKAAQTQYRHAAQNKTYFEAQEIRAMAKKAGFEKAEIYGEPERRVLHLYAENPG